MLKAAINLLAGRATAVDTTKKIMEDFEKLMDSGDPNFATEILKPEVCKLPFAGIAGAHRSTESRGVHTACCGHCSCRQQASYREVWMGDEQHLSPRASYLFCTPFFSHCLLGK